VCRIDVWARLGALCSSILPLVDRARLLRLSKLLRSILAIMLLRLSGRSIKRGWTNASLLTGYKELRRFVMSGSKCVPLNEVRIDLVPLGFRYPLSPALHRHPSGMARPQCCDVGQSYGNTR
jgi:hypothetical protein